jgi:GNAT superfamily N-acetyltransferase
VVVFHWCERKRMVKICVKSCSEDELRHVANTVGMAKQIAENYVVSQRRGEGVFLGAWKDGSPVGHAFLQWNPKLRGEYTVRVQGNFADTSNLSVVEEYRSQGIGSRIIQKAEEEARDRGFELLRLAVDPEDNPRAHALYLRHGFTDVGLPPFDASGTWIDQDGNEHPYEEWCINMTKRL